MEAKGFSFEKIDGVEYLDLSKPKPGFKKMQLCPILKAEQAMRNHFLETSQKRGKSLSILIPLINQEDMTDLLSELYDLRADSEQRKREDLVAGEVVGEMMDVVSKDIDNILKEIKQKKCRPTKKQPKRKPQKKKVAKKK